MASVLNILWDLSAPGARCTVDDLERGVHEAGLARFSGLDGLHLKVWYRDGTRYGSTMVFADAAARDETAGWLADRVSALCGLPPVRLERYEVIAVAEGAATVAGLPVDAPPPTG